MWTGHGKEIRKLTFPAPTKGYQLSNLFTVATLYYIIASKAELGRPNSKQIKEDYEIVQLNVSATVQLEHTKRLQFDNPILWHHISSCRSFVFKSRVIL